MIRDNYPDENLRQLMILSKNNDSGYPNFLSAA